MAEAHGEAVLLQRVCLGEHCHAVFFICSHCDRGHRYCSEGCRANAARQQRRRANGRHQKSPEGRLDHRDRQRDYRRRCRQRQACVTDEGSLSIASPASFQCGTSEPPAALEDTPPQQFVPVIRLRCCICGCSGRFIDPFPRIPRRRWLPS